MDACQPETGTDPVTTGSESKKSRDGFAFANSGRPANNLYINGRPVKRMCRVSAQDSRQLQFALKVLF
jgi:hypothetical protein